MNPVIVAHDQNEMTDDNFRRVGFGFQKADRLLKRRDFKRLYRSSRSVASGVFAIRYQIRPQNEPLTAPKLGVTVSRRVGNAVVRNRVKRLVREFFRCHRDQLPMSIDLNVIARTGAAKQSHHRLRASLETLFMKIRARESHQSTD